MLDWTVGTQAFYLFPVIFLVAGMRTIMQGKDFGERFSIGFHILMCALVALTCCLCIWGLINFFSVPLCH